MNQSIITIKRPKLDFVPVDLYDEFKSQVLDAYMKIANGVDWVPNHHIPKLKHLEGWEALNLFQKKVIGIWMFDEGAYDYNDYWEDELEEEDCITVNSSAADFFPVYSMDMVKILNQHQMSFQYNNQILNSPIKGVW